MGIPVRQEQCEIPSGEVLVEVDEEDDVFELLRELKDIALLTRVATQSVVTSLIEETARDLKAGNYVNGDQCKFCQKAIDKLSYLDISKEDKSIVYRQ